jgi:hypothetical protein
VDIPGPNFARPEGQIFAALKLQKIQCAQCAVAHLMCIALMSSSQFCVYVYEHRVASFCPSPRQPPNHPPQLANGLYNRYHFYYMPKREQSYQLLQMATAMCVDLGLNLSPSEAMSRKIGLRLSHYRKADKPSTEHDAFFCREARRTYLGCYYLSTAIAWITGKPSNMHV